MGFVVWLDPLKKEAGTVPLRLLEFRYNSLKFASPAKSSKGSPNSVVISRPLMKIKQLEVD